MVSHGPAVRPFAIVAAIAVSAPLVVGSGLDSPARAFELSSQAFGAGAPIPPEHTCTGANVSPPLAWREPPAGTAAFALLVEDPDAPGGTWVHWVLYDIPASRSELPREVPPVERPGGGMKQGENDFRHIGYGGPCPPPGPPHRYVFRLFALDAPLGLAPGATRGDLLAAIRGHVLAEARLVGTFARSAAGSGESSAATPRREVAGGALRRSRPWNEARRAPRASG